MTAGMNGKDVGQFAPDRTPAAAEIDKDVVVVDVISGRASMGDVRKGRQRIDQKPSFVYSDR